MMVKKAALICCLITVFLCGCATWQMVREPTPWKFENLEANLPQGWMKYSYPSNLLLLTKDGALLQEISILRLKMNNENQLPITKKKITDDMLLQDISELIVSELSLNQNNYNLKVLQNAPASLGGRDAFLVEYVFNTPDNLKLRAIMYGFKQGQSVYLIEYMAAKQYYFDKDLPDFNRFISEFKIN